MTVFWGIILVLAGIGVAVGAARSFVRIVRNAPVSPELGPAQWLYRDRRFTAGMAVAVGLVMIVFGIGQFVKSADDRPDVHVVTPYVVTVRNRCDLAFTAQLGEGTPPLDEVSGDSGTSVAAGAQLDLASNGQVDSDPSDDIITIVLSAAATTPVTMPGYTVTTYPMQATYAVDDLDFRRENGTLHATLTIDGASCGQH